MAALKIQINILFSVKHSLKCLALDSIFSERFTETMHKETENLILVNSL